MQVTRSRCAIVSVAAALLLIGGTLAQTKSSPEVSGQVFDTVTHKAIEGAWITSEEEATRSDKEGRFALQKKGAAVGVRAVGYSRMQLAAVPDMRAELVPLHVRGLYLSFWGVASQALRNGVLETAAKADFTAVVVDVKGDNGFISHRTQSELGIQAGANHNITMSDPAAFVADLHKRHLYAIARIVTFKDNPLACLRPDLAVKTAQGKLYVDSEKLAWTDPFNHTVWEYNIALAVEAAKEGFDEIQFDYVRFPAQEGLQFSKPNTQANREDAISGFLGAARKSLNPFNVFLSADNFGYVCWNLNDTGIGQSFARIGPVVDYISPMLYPSAFQAGIPGVHNPLSDPYRIVFASLQRAKERTGFPAVAFRPWLQAFSDYAFDKRKFGKVEMEAQIKAAQDAGSGWMLWNPRNVYQTDVLVDIARELGWSKGAPAGEVQSTARR
jgi:hypothetical protein